MPVVLSARLLPKSNSKVVHLRRYGVCHKRLHRAVLRRYLRMHPGEKVLVSRTAWSLSASTRASVGFWRDQCNQRYLRCDRANPMHLATEHETGTEVEDLSDFQSGHIVRFFKPSVPRG